MTSLRARPYLFFPAIALLFFASGATALVYEVAWLRSLILIFGSTAFAVSTVLATFMAGLALGSYAIGRWADRRGWGLGVYGLLELGIGAYALAVPFLFDAIGPIYRGFWTALEPPPLLFAVVRFALCFLVLVLPTAMMGGTLPALARFCARLPRSLVASVGGLYGINTLGAFFGTVLGGFWLLPTAGLSGTVRLTATANIAIGVVAVAFGWAWRRAEARSTEAWPTETPQPGPSGVTASNPDVDTSAGAPARVGREISGSHEPGLSTGAVLIAFAATGFAALMLEVAWTRILALVIGPSVYAFALMLAAFLAGLGLGSVLFAVLIDRFRWDGARAFTALATAAGLLAFGTLLAFHRLPHLYSLLAHRWGAVEGDPGALFGIGLFISGLVMLPPTLAMGGLFPAAIAAVRLAREGAGRGAGSIYAANSGGAIAGAFAAGFLAIPTFGLQGTVLAGIATYLAVAGAVVWLSARDAPRGRWIYAGALAVTAVLVAVLAPPWNSMLMSSGVYHYAASYGEPETAAEFARTATEQYEELYYEEGLVATVLVAHEREVSGVRGGDTVPSVLLISNGKVDASSLADVPTQVLSAHIPLLLHPNPRRGVLIGLASGMTAGSALTHDIESLEIVEIEPAVVEASRYFDFVNGRPLEDPRARVALADGRTYLSLGDTEYDFIISEPSNPWITGVSNLFTLEFFELVRGRLAKDGLFCQWVQMYSMSPYNLRVLIRTFRTIFPSAFVFSTIPYTDLVLVGGAGEMEIDVSRMRNRVASRAISADLERAGVDGPAELLARGRMGPAGLEAFVADGRLLNTDDNAHIEFTAPLDLYRATRFENEAAVELHARGLGPYLAAGDPAVDSLFRARLSEAYAELGFLSEARATRTDGSRVGR